LPFAGADPAEPLFELVPDCPLPPAAAEPTPFGETKVVVPVPSTATRRVSVTPVCVLLPFGWLVGMAPVDPLLWFAPVGAPWEITAPF
jgi:hypothetical protein